MRQELTIDQRGAIAALWLKDVSAGGPPIDWTLESFTRKIEDKLYNGMSFKTAVMRTLAEVPRSDDPNPKEEKKKKLRERIEEIKKLQHARFSKERD